MRGRFFAPNTLPPAEILASPEKTATWSHSLKSVASLDLISSTNRPREAAALRTLTWLTSLPPDSWRKPLRTARVMGSVGNCGGLAAVGDDDAVVAFGGELGQQAAEFFAQNQERLDDLVGLDIEIGQVDGVAHGAVDQEINDGLGHFDADVFLRFLGAGAQVRAS